MFYMSVLSYDCVVNSICKKKKKKNCKNSNFVRFVCVEVLRPSQPNGVMSSPASLPNHTFTGQA